MQLQIPLRPIDRLIRPFQEFMRLQAASGILLLLTTIIAILWANLAPHNYREVFESHVAFSFGRVEISKTLLHWINDGLMSIFFFIVGLEIKREIMDGQLASLRQAALPIAGAIGGMLVPAAIYASLNADGPGANGWGIPMATDIAFAVGILSLLGSRIPSGLKVFLTALAIADDIGAVLVIAVFYTETVSLAYLGAGGLILLLSIAANVLKIRQPIVYFFLGIVVWMLFLKSGVHATISAILMAFTIPVRTRLNVGLFKENATSLLALLNPQSRPFLEEQNHHVIQTIEASCEAVTPPAQRMEHGLHAIVAFLIMPIFALANAGVEIRFADLQSMLFDRISIGVILGLFLGKPLGIFLFGWICVKVGLGKLPAGVSFGGVFGTSMIAGIGFTMSLFIAGLALAGPSQLEIAKSGILIGSLISGIVGFAFLRFHLREPA
ncbi:MAG: Na+/H+ antiporter NhaA [Spirochaetia bacterium]|nr:Na+/H+ antiporter NhaA [Spirochaetia bacterium]